MRDKILALITSKPKHFSKIISNTPELKEWVLANKLISHDSFSAEIYSAVHQVSNICSNGKAKSFKSISFGFVGCGPAATCECTRAKIAASVAVAKKDTTQSSQELINDRRKATMKEKYGVEYNSQRADIKQIWTKPKISDENYAKLTDRNWLDTEYNVNKRSLVDIASELSVYYSTVAEYCKKFDFEIRQTSNYSLCEKEISAYVNSLGVSCVENDWSVLGTKEIDILIPSKKLGIEVNGLFWHSSVTNENSNRHLEKTKLAQSAGIDLLHITDYEWNNKTDIIKNIINAKLGINTTVYARQCSIVTVSTAQEKQFLDSYHLQGYVPSTMCYGLMHNNTLVMLVSVGKSRYSKLAEYEVLRVCSTKGITVVGGISKLMKQFAHLGAIVTYCDRSKSLGNGYIKSGFTYVNETGPGYFWTNGNDVISRYKSQKSNLAKWLTTYNPALSESENMVAANYKRYWDCGNLVFLYQ